MQVKYFLIFNIYTVQLANLMRKIRPNFKISIQLNRTSYQPTGFGLFLHFIWFDFDLVRILLGSFTVSQTQKYKFFYFLNRVWNSKVDAYRYGGEISKWYNNILSFKKKKGLIFNPKIIFLQDIRIFRRR